MVFPKLLTNPAEAKRFAHLPALDGARGLAVLLVLLDHASDSGMRLFPGADLNRLGKYGVYLFFVLSAFLLTHQFYTRRPEELIDARTWINYGCRRFLRIFPVYAVVLVAMIAMEKLFLRDLWTHLLLLDGRRVFWTIPVEVKFYFLLPFFLIALFWAGRKHWHWGVAGLVGAIAVTAGLLWLEQFWSLHENVLLAPNLSPFLMGAASAIAYGRLQRTRLSVWWSTGLELLAIAALLGVILRIPLVFNSLGSHSSVGKFGYDEAVCGALWSVFILGTLLGRGWVARAMCWKPLRYVGLISFSAYLWHWKFLADVDDLPVPPVVRLCAFFAIVLAVASVSYFLLERPLLRLRPRKVDSISAPR